jgi:hypothetical protein
VEEWVQLDISPLNRARTYLSLVLVNLCTPLLTLRQKVTSIHSRHVYKLDNYIRSYTAKLLPNISLLPTNRSQCFFSLA